MTLLMFRSSKSTVASRPSFETRLAPIRKKLARAMVGSTVDLLADSDSQIIAHGIVAGVSIVSGNPKIVVNGRLYDMEQVLTATTSSLH
jgi:hypothetical protein